jgi:TolB-like protein/Flp pilus assembly protein TadD
VKAQRRQTPPSEAPAPAPAETLADPSRQEQLARILRSETFQQADRLKRFLTFVVTEAISGRQEELKEYVIGVQVFRKEETFDPRTDPIVRVQARRLRAKLVRYYREEGRADALIIDLPKGGYAPLFRPRETPVLVKRTAGTLLISRNTVIVERFADHSPGRVLESFCDAVRDELIHQLAQVPGMRVLASRGTEPRGELDDQVRGAAVIVGGSVRQADDQLRTTVHLVDAASNCYLWSEAIDTSRSETFDTQERVAAAVIKKIEPDWLGRRVGTFGAPVQNLAAQNLYVQGRYHLNQRTEEGLRKSVEFFEKALGEGAEFAPAHSGLADAYNLLAHYGVLAPADAWTKAASAASTSVMLDDMCAEAHTSLAHVKATQELDWKGAEGGFLRAISLDPRYATAHHWYAMSCLAPLGRLDEALDEIMAAQSLDPVSSIVSRDVAVVHYYRRDFETALEHCDHTIELNPHFGPAYWMLGVIQEQRRDFDESAAAFQRAVHLLPNTPRMYGALGRTFALAGRRAQALEMLKKLEALSRHRYVSPLEFAWIRFALGEEAAGFRWLTKACADRCFDLIAIKVDPRFDPYRGDARFGPLIAHLGLDA